MIGAFSGGPKPVSFRLPYDTRIESELDKLIGQSDSFRDLNTKALEGYSGDLASIKPKAQATAESASNILNKVAGEQASASPLDDALRYSGAQLGQAKDFLSSILNYGSAFDKLNAARAGLGDRADRSSYFQTLRNDRVGRNVSPVLQSILSGAGRDVTALDAARMNQINQLPWLADNAMSLLEKPAAINLMPIAARNSQENQGANLLAALRAISKSNAAEGTRLKKSTLDKWADFGKAADEGLNSALQIVMSLYGGGLGGMLGGLGGGGGGKAPSGTFGAGGAPYTGSGQAFSYDPTFGTGFNWNQ